VQHSQLWFIGVGQATCFHKTAWQSIRPKRSAGTALTCVAVIDADSVDAAKVELVCEQNTRQADASKKVGPAARTLGDMQRRCGCKRSRNHTHRAEQGSQRESEAGGILE
jgi:hypothetical protein